MATPKGKKPARGRKAKSGKRAAPRSQPSRRSGLRTNHAKSIRRVGRRCRLHLHPCGAPYLARPNHAHVPHLIIRDRITIDHAVPAAGAGVVGTTFLFSPFATRNELPTGHSICRLVGLSGSASQFAGAVGETAYRPRNLDALTECQLRMHRLAVTFGCAGTTGAGVAPGYVHFGEYRGMLRRTSFNTFGDIATFLLDRPETRRVMNKTLQGQTVTMHSRPLDLVSYDHFHEMETSAETVPNADEYDGMTTLFLVVPPAPAATQLVIDVYVEFALLITGDGNSGGALQAASRIQPSASQAEWDAFLALSGGLLYKAARAGTAVEELMPFVALA